MVQPGILYYKYADSPERAVLASANAGGENVNRNALLGAIMGAGHGMYYVGTGLGVSSDTIIC